MHRKLKCYLENAGDLMPFAQYKISATLSVSINVTNNLLTAVVSRSERRGDASVATYVTLILNGCGLADLLSLLPAGLIIASLRIICVVLVENLHSAGSSNGTKP